MKTPTETEKDICYRMRVKSRSFRAIAERLGGDWTYASAKELWRTLTLDGYVDKRRKQRRVGSPIAARAEPLDDRIAMRRANLLHLLDLKRGGYSPTRTEYQITPEGKGFRFRTADTSSYLGSSAASCAMEV